MNYEFTKVKKICEENIANQIYENSKGMKLPSNYFALMVEGISSIFKVYPPEIISAPFSIYLDNGFILPDNIRIYFMDDLKNINYKNANIIILDQNRFAVLYEDIYVDGKDVFSYTFRGKQNEFFYLNSLCIRISDYIDTAMYSMFSCPSYADIDEALDKYYRENAQNSTCYILKDVWGDAARQKLKEKPEVYFQRSLFQFLNIYLRGYTVKREQNVDETHPVDIKATGPYLNTVSLIEIKWIGDSEKVQYRDARANEGAEQLQGYLYASECREPYVNFKGYLAVFDARRKKDKKNYYATVEINYKPKYLADSKLELKRFFLCE